MGSYTAENSPLLSCYPIPPLDADGQLITFGGHGRGDVGAGGEKKKNQNNFEEDSGGLKEGKAGIFGGSSFS